MDYTMDIPGNYYIILYLTLLIGIALDRFIISVEEEYKEKKWLKKFKPLVIEENGVKRFFTWQGRDPVHLIKIDYQDRQLFKFFVPLRDTIRNQTKMEPQFNLSNEIKGEIVYELSADFRAKWRLLGEPGSALGNQILLISQRVNENG